MCTIYNNQLKIYDTFIIMKDTQIGKKIERNWVHYTFEFLYCLKMMELNLKE